MTVSSSTSASLLQQYRRAGLDYTGLAEFSDVSAFVNGTNNYTLKAHTAQLVKCNGLKPNTRVWPRFDGRDVSRYCSPNNKTSYNNALITNAAGSLTFYFKIPNDNTMKFKGYKHLLEVSDVKPPYGNGISSGKVGATTRCGQYYYAASNVSGMKAPAVATTQIVRSEISADSSMTKVTNSQITEEIPDFLSQSFVVTVNNPHLEYVDLYFAKRPANSNASVIVQIRRTDSRGRPTTELISQSDPIYRNSINVSSNGLTKTRFTFKSGVTLSKNVTYALTVLPNEDGTDFELWSATKNRRDKSTNISAYVTPEVKKLYGSATGSVWSPLVDEYLKFNISYKTFSTKTDLGGTDCSFVFENKDLDFLNISDITPTGGSTSSTGFQMDESIRGESILTFANNQTISVGDHLRSRTAAIAGEITDSGYATGTVRKIVASGSGSVTVKIDAFKDYPTTTGANNDHLYLASNDWCGNTSSFIANTTATGDLIFVNTDFGRIRLDNSSGGFAASEYIRGQQFGASAKVDAIIDPKIDSVTLNTSFGIPRETELSWYVKATSTTGSLDSTWSPVTGGTSAKFENRQKRVYSKSNSSNKSLLVRGVFSTSDARVSPIIDADDVTVNASRERINDSTANETFPSGGAEARYISGVTRATNDVSSTASERMKIVTQAYLPAESGVQLYVRVRNDNDAEPIEDKNFTQLTLYSTTPKQNSTLSDRNDRVFLHHRLSANNDGDNFLGLSNVVRENSSNNGVISYRSGDGSVHHGVDEYQLKVVFTRPDGKGTAYSPEVHAISIFTHKSPLNLI